MKIQINSDKTIEVDATLTRFVEGEVSRVLDRFAMRLTRVEVHLSDVDNKKTGRADKRCLIEVRPAGDRPVSASARATKTEAAVGAAAGKMQRSLTTFFGRKGRSTVEVLAHVPAPEAGVAAKTSVEVDEKAAVKKIAVKKPTKLSARGPKKTGIHQARRKAWPR